MSGPPPLAAQEVNERYSTLMTEEKGRDGREPHSSTLSAGAAPSLRGHSSSNNPACKRNGGSAAKEGGKDENRERANAMFTQPDDAL